MTDRQELFVREYLIDLNATAAYRRAGYAAANDRVAASCAHKLLRIAEISEAVEHHRNERMTRLDLDADWVVLGFRMIYLQAQANGRYGAALRALENIARFLGLYETGWSPTPDKSDAAPERLRHELEAAGFDFRRINFPGQG